MERIFWSKKKGVAPKIQPPASDESHPEPTNWRGSGRAPDEWLKKGFDEWIICIYSTSMYMHIYIYYVYIYIYACSVCIYKYYVLM